MKTPLGRLMTACRSHSVRSSSRRLVAALVEPKSTPLGTMTPGASAGREVVNEPFEEQQFGGAGVQLVVEVGEDAFVLHLSGERRVGEDDIERWPGYAPPKPVVSGFIMETCAFSNWCR